MRHATSRDRQLAPVGPISAAALGLVVVGAIDLVANYGRHISLAVPAGLTIAGGVALVVALGLLLAAKDFARKRFVQVLRWGLLAYLVESGMLEYVFLYDRTRGGTIIVLSGMLLVFFIDVPLMLAFTVARYAAPEGG